MGIAVDGRPSGRLRLGLAGPPDAVTGVSGGAGSRDGALTFALASGTHAYLSSDGSTEFDQPPAASALPVRGGDRARLELHADIEGDGEASLWVIEYDETERLRHWRTVLSPGLVDARLDLVLDPRTQAVRVALRIAGSGTVRLIGLDLVTKGVARALTVASGAFAAWPHVSAGGGPPSTVPDGLPPAAPAAAPDGEAEPLTLFLTVDTEDAYFTEPRLMTGEGLGRDHGVWAIADALEERNLRGTFFLNVFEASRQPSGAVRAVAAELADRGHEIALHTHPSPDLEWFSAPLFRKTYAEQTAILRRGRAMLEEWTGRPVVSFRAGGYAINDDTFPALEAAGLALDSSIFFPSPNNHNAKFAVNAPRMAGDIVEIPVTYVVRADPEGGRLEHRKLDFDWLGVEELLDALATLVACHAPAAMFMMHSFSFIDKASLPPERPRSPRARFASEVLFNRFVEIYGPKAGAREAFGAFLDAVVLRPELHVARMCDSLESLRRAAEAQPADVVPVVTRR